MKSFFPLRLIPENTNFNFMAIRKFNFLFIVLLVIFSIFLVFNKGINFGIDFTGGTLIEAKLKNKPDLLKLYDAINKLDLGDVNIQDFENNNIMIKMGNSNYQDENILAKNVEKIKKAFKDNYPDEVEFRKVDFVGPQVGTELIQKGILSIILAFFSIMGYIAFRFEWQYGLGIIVALIHDVIISVGVISYLQLDFDLTSIAAILTIIGYSVNDSVVIYDRIRENFRKYKKTSVSKIINMSINETLSRTIYTVLTTLLAVFVLMIYGGPALHSFALIVFCGIIIGTYSSIYISAPILIYFGIKKFSRDSQEI